MGVITVPTGGLGLNGKGDIPIGMGSGQGLAVMSPGSDGTVKVADSTNANGWKDALAPQYRIAYDADFTSTQNILVSGLSTAYRYEIIMTVSPGGSLSNNIFSIQPNSSASSCKSMYTSFANPAVPGQGALLRMGRSEGADAEIRQFWAFLSKRTGGSVAYRCTDVTYNATPDATNNPWIVGGTQTDYTSLNFNLSAEARSGHLYIVEWTI